MAVRLSCAPKSATRWLHKRTGLGGFSKCKLTLTVKVVRYSWQHVREAQWFLRLVQQTFPWKSESVSAPSKAGSVIILIQCDPIKLWRWQFGHLIKHRKNYCENFKRTHYRQSIVLWHISFKGIMGCFYEGGLWAMVLVAWVVLESTNIMVNTHTQKCDKDISLLNIQSVPSCFHPQSHSEVCLKSNILVFIFNKL